MNKVLSGYAKYYQRALDLNVNGYKTVAGGTGLGKTHGVLQCIKQNLHTRKFIYVSHRHNLLEEMAEKLKGENINHCYLRSDSDTLKEILGYDDGFGKLQALLDDKTFKEYIRYAREKSRDPWKITESKCLENIVNAQKILKIQLNASFGSLEALSPDDAFRRESAFAFSFFKHVFHELSETSDYLNKKSPADKYNTYKFTSFDKTELLERHPIIFKLFPFWRFDTDIHTPVLLITIQKLFSGFFDGSKNVNIYKLKDKVFFLDEFEFLEPVLLDKIIEESKLDNPFVFIAYFYHNISIKLLDSSYLIDHPLIRARLENIWNKIEILKKGSSFPDIRFFGVKDPKVIKSFVGSGLYQANYTSVDQPIYLEVDKDLQKYWLSGQQTPNAPTTFNLMRSIKRITNEILQFYLQLKSDNDKLYDELLDDAYEKTDYVNHLNKLSFFSVMPPRRKDSIQQHPISNFSYLYHRGYSLYVLNKPATQAEPNEVYLNVFMMNSSPERCLLGLIQKNFVFGLSATATLTRYLEHFNLKWIKDEVEFEKDESVLFLNTDEEDILIVEQLSKEKANHRKNSLDLSIADRKCREHISPTIMKLKEDTRFPAISSNHNYHLDRVLHFFNTLDWIIQNPLSKKKLTTIDSHLLFFNSLLQIRSLLDSKTEVHPDFKVTCLSPYRYEIIYFGTLIQAILLDSKAHRYFFDSSIGKQEYEKSFDLSHPTLLITQYPSANNGVNLQYSRVINNQYLQEDYQCIHLLEAPHFYFSNGNARTENDIKSDIWKLAQLFLAGKISKSDFNSRVKGIMNKSANLNKLYKESTDYTLNQVAKIMQAIGRIERVRDREVGLQRGRISEGVLSIFNRYFHNLEIQTIITESSPFFSNLVQLFFSEVSKHSKVKWDKNERNRPSDILTENDKCQHSLNNLLESLSKIQRGLLKGKDACEFIDYWKEMRKSALGFEFSNGRIREKHGVFFCPDIHKKAQIAWDEVSGKIYDYEATNWNGKLEKWDFNAHFRNISKSIEVQSYFHSQGYELQFIDHLNFLFFTPYFFRQIYLGALGEAAVKAIFASLKSVNEERLFNIAHPEDIDLTLFEIVDFLIPELNWSVDAKFYSVKNMSGGEIARRQKQKASEKLNRIRTFQPKNKLVLVNANGDENGHVSFFNSTFELSDEKNSCIIVFPSLHHLKDYLISSLRAKNIALSSRID